MDEVIRYRGWSFSREQVEEIREVIAAHWHRSRRFISREICRRWDWRYPNGALKDIWCRGFLLHLVSCGVIELPASRWKPQTPLVHCRRPAAVQVDQTPLRAKLSELKPIEWLQVRATSLETLYKGLIDQYHYLGYSRPVGAHLEYIALSGERPVACMGWCSAPRHIGCRDRYIGWDQRQRQKQLCFLATNTRFLILPWVEVPHLASHLLGRMARRISPDWQGHYGHELVWLEAFVDPQRGFAGTCYKAANWIYLGPTTGRGKNDHTKKANRSLKAVFGYPLRKDFRQVLCHGLL
jgi:hypothetical protein